MYQDRQIDGKLDYVTVRRWMDCSKELHLKCIYYKLYIDQYCTADISYSSNGTLL